jgi:hypothetical protein
MSFPIFARQVFNMDSSGEDINIKSDTPVVYNSLPGIYTFPGAKIAILCL